MFDIVDLDPELDWRPGDRIRLERVGHYHAVDRKPADVVEAVAAMRGATLAIMPPLPGRLGAAELVRLPRLRAIATSSTAMSWLDVPALLAARVLVRNIPDYAVNSVAEFVFGIVLLEARHLPRVLSTPSASDVPGLIGSELHNKTLGLVGFGGIGQRCAEIGSAFGMRVLVHNRTHTAAGVRFVPLRFLLAHSDYVVVCVRSVPETQALIHHGNVGAVKPGSVLVNISRAGIVVDEAVIQATQTGRIRRYVYELDDLAGLTDGRIYQPAHPPRAIATPHVAWFTAEAAERRRQRLLSNIEDLAAQLAGGP